MTTVGATKYNAVSEWVRQPSHRLFATVGACLVAAALVVSTLVVLRRPTPVIETVTTGLEGAAQPKPPPVVNALQLPARDEDVERAGDKIAEATVYLSHKQKASALSALREARASARRAYDRRAQQQDPETRKLIAAMRELEQAESSVERGTFADARQKLLALNRHLDQVGQ
jgi:hypothetical protein